jgi:hypothetical protein
MPEIGLTTFIDFVAATGTGRLTKARQAKQFYEQGYAPERDYYKPLRDRIVRCFEGGWSATRMKDLLDDIDDPKKLQNYEACRRGLSKWVGRKKISVFQPQKARWRSGDLVVNVNPELRGTVNDEKYAIKLYLKADALSQQKANIALRLIQQTVAKDATPGVLDVRRGKLFEPTRDIEDIDALLEGEALALATMWDRLP